MRIYAFADEASPAIDGQIAAMRRNGLNGLEIRGVDGENVSAISLEKAKEVRRKLETRGCVPGPSARPSARSILRPAILPPTLSSCATRWKLPRCWAQSGCGCSPSTSP